MDTLTNVLVLGLFFVFIVLLVGNLLAWFKPSLLVAFFNIGYIEGKNYKGLQKYGFDFINSPSYKWYARMSFGVAIIVLVVGMISVCSGFGQISEEDQSSEIDLLVPSVKDIHSKAKKLALEWNSDAKLMQIQVEIVNPSTSYVENPKILLQYESEKLDNEMFGVICKNNRCTGEAYQVQTTLISQNVSPILVDMIQVDCTDAAIITLENGGSKYLRTQAAFDLANLRFDFEGNLYWVIILSNEKEESFSITIDSSTGEVIES